MASDLCPIKVLIATRRGDHFRLSAGPATTVGMLKEQLREQADGNRDSCPRFFSFPSCYFFVANGRRVLDNAALGRVAFESRPRLLAVTSRSAREQMKSLKRRDDSGATFPVAVKATSTGAVFRLEVKPSDTSETIKACLLAMASTASSPNVVQFPSCYHLVLPRTGEVLMPNIPLGDLKWPTRSETALVILTNQRLTKQMLKLRSQMQTIRAGAARTGAQMLSEALEEPVEAEQREEEDLWAYGVLSQVQHWVYRKWKKIRDAFRSFDADKSGLVSTREFLSTLRNFGLGLSVEQERVLVQSLDPNGDGLVSYYEFLATIEASSNAKNSSGFSRTLREPTSREKKNELAVSQIQSKVFAKYRSMRKAFLEFDLDRSGSIDPGELQVLFQRMGIDLIDEELDALVSKFDTDGNGLIDYNEFANAIKC